MPVKVSVIVPVYNPGPYIEDCIASLLRQSLPPDEFEAIFVDDGSTDATPARLDRLAAEHPHMHVIHQENSGWSGKPRNVGIAAAEGEFVMFVDNDDYLGDEALERMYAYGTANGADIVVGKMAGKGRPVPVELFRVNRPHATVGNAPLIDSLTPHKMVRRAFLERTGLRFPEGRRRLEDHVFFTEAYLRAANVSVLSDYVCYYHVRRDDESNAGIQRFDAAGYFRNLREALDIVDRHTEPGPLRDRLYRRWLRVEMVERMSGRRMLALPDDYRRELFHEMHQVVTERFGPAVAAGLRPGQRIVAELITAGRYDDLVAYGEREATIVPRAVPDIVVWQDGVLRIGFTAEYVGDGTPLAFPAEGAPASSGTPPRTLPEALAWLCADATARFPKARAELMLRDRDTAAQFFQPIEVTRETVPADGGRVRLVLRGTATVDPASAAGGAPLGDGLWDAHVRVTLGGWSKDCRLGPAPRADRPAPDAGVIAGRVVLPYWTEPRGNLSLDVDRARKRLGLSRLTAEDVTVSGDRLSAVLPVYVPADAKALLRLTGPSSRAPVHVPATLTAVGGPGALLEALLPLGELNGATWRAALSLAPDADEPRLHSLPLVLRGTAAGVQVRRAPVPGGRRRVTRAVRRILGALARRTGIRRAVGKV